ncbi:META domain-containing protein [Streptomyces sp. NPDC000983]|uniref:META domain-containing protein n=1 Tax=Streptomyces sp. NPDC000983 TaxID=3154373 RepID=UPI003325EB05
MTFARYTAAAVTGVALLAACGTESGSGSAAVGDGEKTKKDIAIADTRWVPQRVTVDGEKYALPTDVKEFRVDEAHIVFKPGTAEPGVGGGRSGGTVGCNGFGADVTVEGDTVRIADLAATEMGCPGPVQEFEERFLSVFTGTLEAGVQGRDGARTLTLTRGGGDAITLKEGPVENEPEPALTGTEWTVDTLTRGESAESLPKGVEAHFTLAEDGTVSGSIGCNTFRGEATVEDGVIDFGRLSTTRRLCDAMKYLQPLTDNLSGKVSYLVKDGILTLTNPSGKGLTARAAAAEK